ncbi:MAG TPA: NADPH:quinone reductase [Streptosporangiaceae bacterium]|nr:NADPH:quinone reductase [Streptosporangiaceae bacterium]
MNHVAGTMTGAYITECGPPENIRIGKFEIPVPGATEVLVRSEAMAVNHVDTFIRSGAYRTNLPFPFIIGRDLVGTVERAGERVAGFTPGDRVWCNSLGYDGRQGSFAEYAVIAADRLYHLPGGVSPAEAAAVLHTAATAHIGLFREARIRFGETIVVFGAAGGVGSAVVQLAAATGARVIAVARAGQADWCRACGAEQALDAGDPALTKVIADLVPDGVAVLWDTTGTHDLTSTLPLLARGGRIIAMAGLSATPVLPAGQLYTRDASIRGFVITNASTADLASAARTVNHGLATGILKPRIAERLPLTDAANAHRHQESGVRGRIVVLP